MNISRTKIQEWIEKFGHINEQQLKELARSNEVYGLNIGCNEHLINCSICLKAKLFQEMNHIKKKHYWN
jgi:hypothetical protein